MMLLPLMMMVMVMMMYGQVLSTPQDTSNQPTTRPRRSDSADSNRGGGVNTLIMSAGGPQLQTTR